MNITTGLRRLGILVAVIVVLFMWVLPQLLRLLLIGAIEKQGFDESQVGPLKINWLHGLVELQDVSLARQGEAKLSFTSVAVDIAWLDLLSAEVTVENAWLREAKLAVIERDGHWELVLPLPSSQQPDAGQRSEAGADEQAGGQSSLLPRFDVRQLTLSDIEILLHTSPYQGVVHVDQLQLQGLSSWRDDLASVSLTGRIGEAPVSLSLNAKPFQNNPQIDGRLQLSNFDLAAIKTLLPASLALNSAVLSSDMSVQLQRDHAGHLQLSASGTTAMKPVSLMYEQLAVTADKVAWQGVVQAALDQTALQYAVSGDIAVDQVQVQAPKHRMSLIALQALAVKQLQLRSSSDVNVAAVDLKALQAVHSEQAQKPWLALSKLAIKQLQFSPERLLAIETIEINDSDLAVNLDDQGQLEGQADLQAVLAEVIGAAEPQVGEEGRAADAVTPAHNSTNSGGGAGDTEPALPFDLVLSRLELSDTEAVVRDRRFDNTFAATLQLDHVVLLSLDSRHPEQTTTLTASGRLDEFSSLQLKASAKPFVRPLVLDLKGELIDVSLPQVSPYAEAFIGYQLQTGHYDHRFDLSIANQRLTLKNDLELRNLELKAVDDSIVALSKQAMQLPLPMALDMLRDGDGTIRLQVPVQGDVKSFNVGVSDVLRKALFKAMSKGSISYLTYTLQPYGGIVLAADYLLDKATTLRFEPMVFAPGSSAIDGESRQYADKLAGLLLARDTLQLNLCGRAGADDQQWLSEQRHAESAYNNVLLALAADRAKQLKRVMIENGVPAKRLYLCKPAIDSSISGSVLLSM